MASISPTVSSTAASFPVAVGEDTTSKLIYYSSDSSAKKKDFSQGLCCILYGFGNGLIDKNGKRLFECIDVPQMQTSFIYDKNEKIISKFVRLKYTGEEDIFGEADIHIRIPHCMSRTSALHREPVIKVKLNNAWVYLETEETTCEEYKDVRLAEARFTGGVPSFACVVTRYKKDTIRFSKQSTRNSSSVDQRFSIKSENGCFTGKPSFSMQIQPIDSNTVTRLQSSLPDGRSLISSSNIISIAWGSHKFKKTVTVNLPIPANPVKMKKLAKAEAAAKAENNNEKKKRTEVKKDEKSSKWYLGIYGDEENDSLFLFYVDQTSETWVHYPDISLVEIRKDLLSFVMPKPLHKFVVLRCRTEVNPVDARRFVCLLEEELSYKAVKFILFQSPREHSEVTVHCVSVQKADALYNELYDKGWRFHGTNGPPTSKQVMLKEGSLFEVGFRGNIRFDERFHPSSKKIVKYFNSELPCQVSFTITELDKHLQKNYDFYKGVCTILLVDKPAMLYTEFHNTPAPSRIHRSSSSSSHNAKKASSNIVSDKKKVLAELMLQLAKGIDNGPQTPQAGKLILDLNATVVDAIEGVAQKLGKEWEVLAMGLGLNRGRIEALKSRNKNNADYVKLDMLYTWIKRQPRAADQLPKLYYSLMNCGRIDLAYKVEDLYCASEDSPVDVKITPAAEEL